MNNDFPRILSLLRKERKLSQKQVAHDLSVAQALLSHYENGKRECGLDFLIRAADYYSVSTDYLLGRSAVSAGTFITENDIPDAEIIQKAGSGTENISAQLSKKLIISGIEVVYSLLAKFKNSKLTASISEFLTLSVYSCFRLTYRANSKNDANIFGIKEELALRSALAGRSISEGNAIIAADETGDDSLPVITTATLEADYNRQATALLSLIKSSENQLKKINN
ncbi:MAG: helix-turn-helix domain-containing protein [Oscillospiraceae bacterium]|nr:helix-turn-helix domain-containing protein [Oscillospiraceae bacterium]